ncbi:3'-5' exonuclease [Saccharothrix texasensis]|uniref:Exonuclease n=1 Tax=Saccharothrix texasensis TaxID=103734 RepID=A0A3N1H5T4_9PSEU|nr:3'-5' exonuclease [Saccharothrix texasensis]ROP37914.1 exonuclease [Saccharothrix texasensis]
MSEVYRSEVPEHLMTTAQLRSSGMQPGDTTVAAGWLERVFEGDVWLTALHDVRSARSLVVPPLGQVLPVETSKAAATPARSTRSDAAAWARGVLQDHDAVVLDTELTDFDGRVIEIAVLAVDGTVLLSTLVDPEGASINHHAERTHGISAAMLTDAPTMAQVWPRLEEVLRGKTVIAWNAPFDQARLRAEHEQVTGGATSPDWLAQPWECAMRRHAVWVGEPSSRGGGYRNHKLEGGHRAQGDCQAVLERLRQMASTAARGGVRQGPDLYAIRAIWPELLGEVRRRSRSTEAMLTSAELLSVADRTLVVRHKSAPLNRRLAEDKHTAVVNEALATVVRQGWSIRVEAHDAHPQATISKAPALVLASVDESDGEH